jgi:serine/threonine protein kinase
VVYRAVDVRLDRTVALKVLAARATGDPERRRRFIQEAKAASALNHPNIITIYEIDQAATPAGPVDFIAMEYVDGETLERRIGRKGLALGEALDHAVQIADALAKAHGAGIVHRDIKPANLMVTREGRVKVLDFGLAKLTERVEGDEFAATIDAAPRTEEGTIAGTISYMSPEQAEGKPIDARSDIFAFGSVLYEMISGQRAFRGETKVSTLSAVLREEPAGFTELGLEAPREVERLIRHCLRKDPRRRFQHMEDVKTLLEELKEESDSGTLVGAEALPARRGRAWIVSVAAVLVVAAAGAVVWRLRKPPATARPLVLTQLTRDPGLTTEPALSPDGKLVAYASDRAGEGNLDIWVQQLPVALRFD